MGVRVVFLPDCHLVLSLFKHRSVGAFLNKKQKNIFMENKRKQDRFEVLFYSKGKLQITTLKFGGVDFIL